MNNDRLAILLPFNTQLSVNGTFENITHMQIKKNDNLKCYELRYFNKEKFVYKNEYKNLILNVVTDIENKISIYIGEKKKTDQCQLLFEQESDILQIKKYVDTLLI